MKLFLPIDSAGRDALLQQPEDGMGWQWGQVIDGVVLEETIIVGSSYALNPRRHYSDEHSGTGGMHGSGMGDEKPEPVKVVTGDEAEAFMSRVAVAIAGRSRGGQRGDFWEKTLEVPTIFNRYCAFASDPRIRDDGSVAKGTYATTETEKPMVPSGLAAVGRFALPIRTPAKFVVTLVAPAGTPIRYRTVEPNYGLCGGGVEVLFPEGLPDGSATRAWAEIPEM
jgi:hypothetical protein